jgi:hypothetical protein
MIGLFIMKVKLKHDTEIYNSGNAFGLIFKPSGRYWRGMYFGLYLDLSVVYRSYQDDHFIGLNNKFEIGYHWIFKNGFTKGVALCGLIPRPLGRFILGVRGICSPVYTKLPR